MITDYLHIEGLKIDASIGIHDWEKKIKQLLVVDMEIAHDFSNAGDDIKNTIDYDALCQHITELVQSRQFNIIETVAQLIVTSIESTFNIKAMTVRVSKPHAIASANNISVVVKRGT